MPCLISLDFYILPLASSTSCTVILSIPGTPLFCLTFSIVIFKFSLLLPSRITFPSSRLSLLSNYPNIAYSDLHSINVSVLHHFWLLWLHQTSCDKSFSIDGIITVFNSLLDFIVHKVSRGKAYIFFIFTGFWFTVLVCSATLSPIQPHQISFRNLEYFATPLPSPIASLLMVCGSLLLAVNTRGGTFTS